MTKVHSATVRGIHPHTIFRAFKYVVYALIGLNVVLFFQEDFLASKEMFGGHLAWRQLSEAFSATIDTAAWAVLLLLFELETAIISDEKLKGSLKWILMGVRLVSYSFILWAFYGYVMKYTLIADTLPFTIDNVCNLIGSGYTWIVDLDQYRAIDQAACQALQGQALMQIGGTQIIGTVEAARAARNLTLIDIINAADWLLIVVLLELEVNLQLRNLLSDRLLLASKFIKGILYSTLLFCAIYWGILGDFLDFWDAFLWLLAFVFIEMNIFQWHEELAEERGLEMRPEPPEHGVSMGDKSHAI